MIIKYLLGPLFFRKKVAYEYPCSIEDAVGRLRHSLMGVEFHNPLQACVVGKASKSVVVLRWYRPFYGYSFTPTFKGIFRESNGTTILEGEYSIYKSTKIFTGIWLGVATAILLMFLTNVIIGSQRKDIITYLGIPAGLVLFGVLSIHIGWAIGKVDINRIDFKIKESINHSGILLPLGVDGCPAGNHEAPQLSLSVRPVNKKINKSMKREPFEIFRILRIILPILVIVFIIAGKFKIRILYYLSTIIFIPTVIILAFWKCPNCNKYFCLRTIVPFIYWPYRNKCIHCGYDINTDMTA